MTDGWIRSEEELSFFHKMLRKIMIKRSDAWIGASAHSAKLLKHYSAIPTAIFRSHLCVDNDNFYSPIFEKRTYDIMFSGQFIKRKLPDFFIDVATIIKKKRGFCKAMVLGDGPLEADFKIKLNTAIDGSKFFGFVEQNKLPDKYSDAKVFLFPTAQEPWGIVANEACAAGTPVITCNNAGVSNDLIIHNYNGFILPLDAEIWANHAIMLLEHVELWKCFSKNARKKVQEYNFNVAAEGIVRAIQFVSSK
jgi:glycosyltransferase involved in cell wall biosynthesis